MKSNFCKLQINYRDKTKKDFPQASENLEQIKKLIQKGFKENTLLYIQINNNDNDMQAEFGENCCFISMTDEENGVIYGYVNESENSEKIIDLYVNCYSGNMLCVCIYDIIKIVETFILTGKPNKNYKWEESEM